mmetsp:Transcript_27935/g.70655  ORF Transcript_27935/g.70655 Transcript_27935/m.70655 type:complete len:372 (+) Transcript_27935:2230-3345(+)
MSVEQRQLEMFHHVFQLVRVVQFAELRQFLCPLLDQAPRVHDARWDRKWFRRVTARVRPLDLLRGVAVPEPLVLGVHPLKPVEPPLHVVVVLDVLAVQQDFRGHVAAKGVQVTHLVPKFAVVRKMGPENAVAVLLLEVGRGKTRVRIASVETLTADRRGVAVRHPVVDARDGPRHNPHRDGHAHETANGAQTATRPEHAEVALVHPLRAEVPARRHKESNAQAGDHGGKSGEDEEHETLLRGVRRRGAVGRGRVIRGVSGHRVDNPHNLQLGLDLEQVIQNPGEDDAETARQRHVHDLAAQLAERAVGVGGFQLVDLQLAHRGVGRGVRSRREFLTPRGVQVRRRVGPSCHGLHHLLLVTYFRHKKKSHES